MKDPSLNTRPKKSKLKLVVSFNGEFRRLPPSGELRYSGGETKIISVERFITFSRLKAKIADPFVHNDAVSLSPFSLSYLHHIADEEERHVSPIASDDDVRRMISEFEKLEAIGKRCRLWVFACSNSNQNLDFYRDVDNGFDKKRVLHVNCEKLSDGCSLLCGKHRGLSENLMTQLSKSEKDGKCGNDSLRKMVLKQQLVTKKSDKIRGVYGGFEKNGNESDRPPIDLSSRGETSLSIGGGKLGFGGELNRVNMLDYEYRKSDAVESEKFGEVLHVAVPNSRPLDPKDGNLRVGLNGSMRGLLGQARLVLRCGDGANVGSLSSCVRAVHSAKPSCNSNMNSMINGFCHKNDLRSLELAFLGNMNRENIIPSRVDHNMVRNGFPPHSNNNQLVGGANTTRSLYSTEKAWGGYNGGIRTHGFGSSETTNLRICPYPLRNRGNVNEMGNHRKFRLDKRPWVGRIHPVLRLSSSISKHGQATRSNNFTLWKTWSGSHHDKFGVQGPGYYGTNFHSTSFKRPYCGQEIPKHVDENLGDCFLAYDGPIRVNSAIEDPSPCPRARDNKRDLLTGPDSEKLKNRHQTQCASILDVPLNCQFVDDPDKKLHLTNQQEIDNISSFPDNPCSSRETELSCNSKLLDVQADCKTYSNHQNVPHTLKDAIASPVDISLRNLSLSSKRVESPVPSPARNDIFEALQMPESKHSNVVDEEHFISGLKFEKSSIIASDSSFGSDAKMEKDNVKQEEIQRSHLSNLTIDKKDEDTDGNISSEASGRTSTEVAAFYNHLATRALQTIKNSDLEYIKELGSGAYGTVYYGKWKGSDVAIKRIKPNCFTEGTMEENRLVADFWKEAHILGQLHHPNIVALYGVVTDGPVNNLATVTEYMVNGSLKQVLQRKDRTIDRRKRLIIAMDAAFGMEYLHEKNIVHFDLKSHNLLVNMRDPQRPVCKIGDLGLSKIKQRTLVSGGVRGTIPWMAPELFNAKSMVSEKIDVYSFGIVLWELLTGEEPYANLRSEEIIAGIIKGSLRPETPSWCDPLWRSLMERCWSADPDTRPSFLEIAKELRAMAAAMNIK